MASVLAQFAANLTRAAASAGAREKLALHVLDTMGAWLAGTRTEDGALIERLGEPMAGIGRALGEGMLDLIARRVAIIRNTEIDDIHMASCTTPGSVVVPAALTLAAASPSPSASSFAAALVAGYEAMTRLSTAVSGATILYRGVWPSFFAAPVAAAATASAYLGLDGEQTAGALAMALALTSGAAGGHGEASPRFVLLGQAARAGVFAALAAAKGFRGDPTLLDGDWLNRTHGIAADPAPLVAASAGEGAIAEVSYKPYCSAKQGMAAIDAFRQLLAKTEADRIAAVTVAVPPAYAGMIGHRNAAAGRIERITSAAYQLALAAFRPDLLDDVVRPDLTKDPKIAAFIGLVEVRPDPELAPYFPALYPARVEAKLKDGSTVALLVTDAAGDPAGNFAEREARAKFHRLADPVIGQRAAASLAAAAIESTISDPALAALAAAAEKITS